jgi:hypothetical protein
MQRFWRGFAIFLIGGMVGAVLGFGGRMMFFAMPSPPATDDGYLAASTGTFMQADPDDPRRWGKGEVSVYGNEVLLEPDFEVAPGPGLHVYLVPKEDIREPEDLDNVMYLDLGELRAFKGRQGYPIPAGVDVEDYLSVVIWSEQLDKLMSPAELILALR